MRVDVLRGSPRSDELAALLAVVTEAYAEESAAATVDDEAARPKRWSLVAALAARSPCGGTLGWGRFTG